MTASERLARFVHELDTARRVIPRPDAALGHIFETTDKAPTRLLVVLKSGAHHVREVDYPRGSPGNPATRAELEAKFDALAAPALPAGRPAEIRTALLALERAPAIRDVVRLCVRTEGGDSVASGIR